MKVFYPDEFIKVSGVYIKDETLNDWINEAIDYLETNTDDNYCVSAGDSIIVVLRTLDGYYAIISKDYSEANIELESLIDNNA